MFRRYTFLAAAAAGGLFLWARRRAWTTRWLDLPPVRNRVRITRKIPIPMPDGVTLLADHYAPVGAGPHPTVLIRTPYGRGWEAFPGGLLMTFAASRFAERGYHVLVQGTRGQFDSGGQFVPFVHEKEDGLATLAWLRRQPWFSGQIGMWGNSYLGLVQWALAGEAGPELRALVPVTTSADLRALLFGEGAFGLELAVRWVLGVAGTGTGIVRKKASFWQQMKRLVQVDRLALAGFETVALTEADRAVLGEPASFFQLWLETDGDPEHPYWQASNFKAHLPRTEAAVHLVAGWYDIFLRDQLDDYQILRASGRQPFLTIGPWGHMDGEAIRSPLREAIAWFDGHLRGESGRLRPRPVQYFLMGAEAWREADQFPPESVETALFLQPGNALAWEAPAAAEGASTFTFDPARPTPAVGGVRFSPQAGRTDNRPLEARGDVLIFTSEPLAGDLDVIGAVRARIYLETNRPSTDVYVRLNDVRPDGRSTNVCDGLTRVEPGAAGERLAGALEVAVDLWSTAYRFKKGHRLRVLIAGGAHPRWARNPGTGERRGAATRLVAQENTIVHRADCPSAVFLPVAR